MTWEIRQGDCRELLREVEAESVDLIATDPPYGISFMGKHWDKALPDPAIWREALRVCKPGAFAFVLCTPRSDCLWRMCRDLEEAGWDLTHSQMYWVYRSGFPKALDIGKDFDKAAFMEWLKSPANGTAETRAEAMGWGPEEVRKAASAAVNGDYQNPAARNERECSGVTYSLGSDLGCNPDRSAGASLLSTLLARFPDAPGVRVKVGERTTEAAMSGTKSGVELGTGGTDFGSGVNVVALTSPSSPLALAWDGWKSPGLKPACECIIVCQKPFTGPVRENVRQHGVGGFNVEAARIPFAGTESIDPEAMQNQQASSMVYIGGAKPGDVIPLFKTGGRFPANLLCSDLALGEVGSRYFDVDKWSEEHGIDEDGWVEAAAAGLVQVAKPGKREKEEGLVCEPRPCGRWNGGGIGERRKQAGQERSRNHHPTCKPVRLMSYLIHLACPPSGIVLDPFAGSGTTGVAAVKGGWNFLGMELDADYCEIARARIEAALPEPTLAL